MSHACLLVYAFSLLHTNDDACTPLRMADPKYLEVGQRIRAARLAAGYHTGLGFTRAIGAWPGTLWRNESGRSLPSPQHLIAMRKVIGVSIDWLLTGEGPAPTPRTDNDNGSPPVTS
jgi:hypothetical protein